MGASYSNPLVDSALVFPAPPSSYSEDTPGLLRLRSKFMPGTDVPAFLIRPRVRATTSSRFLSDRATGGGTGSNTVCRSGGTDPSLFSAHYSHVPHQVQSSTSPCLHSASSPSSYPCVSPNSLRGVRASVRVSCPRARTPSRLQPPFLCPASSRITPRRGSGGFSRVPDTSCLGSRFFPSTACHSLPREAYSSNLARGETATRIHPAHGALGGDGGFSGEVKGFPGQRKSCTAGTEAQSAARSTRGGLFLRKEERGECCATAHGDHAYALTPCGSGSSFLGPKSEGETLTSEGSGGRSFLSQEERKRTDKGFCMLYFHGNACDANMMRGWLQLLADELKVTILIFEYPGYGLLEDYDKSSRGIDLCARVAFEFLVEKLLFPIERIILCGRSIGTGAAAWLAAHLAQRNVQVGGLVLIAPFVSLAAVAADWADAPLVLTRVLVHHHWNSEAAVAQIPLVPLCIIHGKE
ncbi:abhydrolase domain-containing protein, partial [Cystoisospora suis]